MVNRLFSRYSRTNSNADGNSDIRMQRFDLIRQKGLYRTVAFICGKGDNFTSITSPIVRRNADNLDKSWEVLRAFYPDFRIEQNFPISPSLFLLENPYGDAAVLPAKAESDQLAQYRYLIMTGWNIADEDFSNRLLTYVQSGGTLLLTWAHLYTSPERILAVSHQSPVLLNDDIRVLTGAQETDFPAGGSVLNPTAPDHKGGLIDRRVGEGRVLLLNSRCYPGERPVRHAYLSLVRQIAQENCEAEFKWGWVSAGRGVHTLVYEAQDRRIFYLADVRRKKPGIGRVRATLHMGEAVCGFPVEREGISVMTLFPGLGVLTTDGAVDLTALEGDTIRLSGFGPTKMVLFRWVDGEIHISERWLELHGETVEKI